MSSSPESVCQTDQQSLWDRIDFLRGELSISKFLDMHGISEATYHGSKHRGSVPKSVTLKDWAAKIGCNADWLITGRGEPYDNDEIFTKAKCLDVSDAGNLDYDTLVASIETIEIYLAEEGLVLDPKPKAAAIAAVYGIFASDMEKSLAERSIKSLLSFAN